MTPLISFFAGAIIVISILRAVASSRNTKKMNVKYSQLMDDTLRSMNQTLSKLDRIEKTMLREDHLLGAIPDDALMLPNTFPLSTTKFPMPGLIKPEVEIKGKSITDYISHLMYARDNFAQGKLEKKVLDKIISNIEKNHGTKS